MNEETLTQEIHALTVSATDIQVQCDVDYQMAAVMLKEFKSKETQVREFFKPLVAAAHATHKALTTRLNETVGPLSDAKKTIGSEMGRYQAKREEERRAEEERLQKEADDSAIEAAAFLEDVGRPEEAASMLDNVPAVQVEPVALKVAGTSVRTHWKYEIEDESLLPREFLCADEKAIWAQVRVAKEHASIPGVRVYMDTKVS